MKLIVEVVKENNDGSADAMVHFDKEALELLVEEGLFLYCVNTLKRNEKTNYKLIWGQNEYTQRRNDG